jgi:putative colanic acid biosynthesis UDP-glucose lipid carrier transferase
MNFVNRRNYFVRFFVDLMALGIVFILTVIYIFLKKNNTIAVSKDNSILLIFSSFSWYFAAKFFNIYKESRSPSPLFAGELICLLKTILLHTLIFSFFFFLFFTDYPYPRTFITLYAVLAVLILSGERHIVKNIIKRLRMRGNFNRKVLIVGAGVRGMHFYDTVVKKQQNGYVLSGFVDDDKKEYLNGEYLGTVKDLDSILKSKDVDDVVIALPTTVVDMIIGTIKISEHNAKRVKILPNYGIPGLANYTDNNYSHGSLGEVRTYPLDEFESRLLKRGFDILFSLTAILLLLSWLFPIFALLIKLESKGPVLFRQLRTGLNNKDFWCLKFRSMQMNDKADQIQATKNDARTTRIGRFLRKSSLDELPQLFNVFMGNMSLVGPRPHMVNQNKDFASIVNEYMLRHFVKPGMTGWAQVNGYRGEINNEDDIKNRVQHDLWYIENWKFSLDVQIVLQTMIMMVKGDDKAF